MTSLSSVPLCVRLAVDVCVYIDDDDTIDDDDDDDDDDFDVVAAAGVNLERNFRSMMTLVKALIITKGL